ncbi:MAG: ParB N-terminal domain-containing protein, partial [Xanthobacteraceae bacterium]
MIAEMSFPAMSDAPEITRKVKLGDGDEYPISDIKVGSRIRRDLGDIDEFARSIAEVGLLHPIVIRADGTLSAGTRRLAACKALGWPSIPVRVVDLEQIARGEFAENAYRKGFLPSEIYEIWRALEPIERAAAQERQKATRFGSGGGKFPPPS